MSDSHKTQLDLYRLLLKKCKDIDVEWGTIVYIPTKTEMGKKSAPVVVTSRLDAIENTLKRVQTNGKVLREALTGKKVIPPRVKNFLCDGWCDHATFCFTDERVYNE